ncbi:MAG: LamG-like jellyroll fold domain-containing protein [Candidatus Zambryskibacteria bacterium]
MIENCLEIRIIRAIRSILYGAIFFVIFFVAPSSASAGLIYQVPSSLGLSSGLVGYWTMDGGDISGANLTDRSPAGTYTGTISGAVPAIGKLGQALNFNGTSDYVDIGVGPTSVQSISFWIYPKTTTEYFLNLTSNTKYVWSNAGTVTATGFTAAPTIYVNGAVSSTIVANKWQYITLVTTTAENASNLDISRTQDTNYLEGYIDDVRLYSSALSASEIKRLYNMGAEALKIKSPVNSLTDGLVGYWTMDGKDMRTALGETAVLATYDNGNGTYLLAQKATLSSAGTVQSMSFLVSDNSTGSLRMGIYDDDGAGGNPGTLLAETQELTSLSTYKWNTANIVAPVTLQPGNYWLAFHPSSDSMSHLRGGAGTGNNCYYTVAYGALPGTFSASPTCSTDHWMLFATLTGGSGNGIAWDLVGNYIGVVYGAITKAIGKIGQGLNFQGSGDYIDGSFNANVLFTGAATGCAWAKADTLSNSGGFQDLILVYPGSEYEATGMQYYLAVKNDGTVESGWTPDNSNFEHYVSAAGVITTGKWYHICAVRTSTSNVDLYVNGSAIADTPSGNFAIPSGVGQVVISSSDSTYDWNGPIDDVRIYNRALSASEVKRLYNMGAEALKIKSPTSSLTNGLVGYWTFDGSKISGANATDSSPAGTNTGTITGATKTIGKIGQTLSFDGTNDQVNIGNVTSFDNISPLTVSLWAYPRSTGASQAFISTAVGCCSLTGTDTGWFFGQDNYSGNPTQLSFSIAYSGGNDLYLQTATNVATLNQWNHFVVTWDGTATGAHIYKNGTEVGYSQAQASSGSRTDDSSTNLVIGEDRGGANDFTGNLDDVRIYSRALSADEVKRLYNMGK